MRDADRLDTGNLGFLLAKASQRWNELLAERFFERGFGEVRPSYGSVLLPLFEEDGLRMGQIAERARLSKQTMTTLVRLSRPPTQAGPPWTLPGSSPIWTHA